MLSEQAKKTGGNHVAKVDITSLIDIVFLLLIFLMVVAITAFNETNAELNLPVASQANPEKHEERDRLIINVDRDGDIYVMNTRMSAGALGKLLKQVARRTIGEDGYSERPIYIRADENRPFGEIHDVMNMCREARIWKLSLRAAEEKEP